LSEALEGGFIIGIKTACFSVTKRFEDYRITLERVTMAAKWTADQRQGWDDRGMPACEDTLKMADEVLDRAREEETT
jgi:hypothetical protein